MPLYLSSVYGIVIYSVWSVQEEVHHGGNAMSSAMGDGNSRDASGPSSHKCWAWHMLASLKVLHVLAP